MTENRRPLGVRRRVWQLADSAAAHGELCPNCRQRRETVGNLSAGAIPPRPDRGN